jgi:hypothetical protein
MHRYLYNNRLHSLKSIKSHCHMHISFFLWGLMANSYFTEKLIHRNSVFFKYTQLQTLYLMTQMLFPLQISGCLLLVQTFSMNKVKEWGNMRWYYCNTDLKMAIKAMGTSLLPKYIYKSEFRNPLTSLFCKI